ncbi:MAG: hybrid sensor histidine kinase/response regulator [Phycisphaerales bacterium]
MTQPAPMSILLVEDNPSDARLVQELLDDSPAQAHAVAHAHSLAEAIDLAHRQPFDIALLDLSLPDSRGLETVHAFRTAAPDLPVVVLTGLDDEALALEALRHGAQDYLAKDHADRYTLNRAVRYAVQRRNAERVEGERRSLQDAVHGMERVLGVVGHELRTPLAAFRLLLEALETGPGHAELDRSLKMLAAQALRMSETVTNVLEASRLDSGVAVWNWATFPLHQVIHPAAELVRPLLEPGVELVCDIQPRDAAMSGDPDAVQRLLINLLSNAAKHTRSGRITVQAAQVPDEGGPWTRIRITDSGRGIPPDVLARLGTAFALNAGVVGACSTGGTGLGLSICAAIAAAHGGHIHASSDGRHGACFTAHLRSDRPAPQGPTLTSAAPATAAARTRPQVLPALAAPATPP